MPEIGTSGLMSGDGKRRVSDRARPRLYPGLLISCWVRLGHGVSLRFVRRDRGSVVAGVWVSGSRDVSGQPPRLSWPGALEIAGEAGEQHGLRTSSGEGDAHAGRRFGDASGDLEHARTQGGELSGGQWLRPGDGIA
jgi:hypothetical protein